MHLETARLTSRPCPHDEADRLLDIQSRMEVVKWLSEGEPVPLKHLDEAHERIEGYATEAASAVISHGFDAGLPEVYAITHTTNAPSQAVCRRLGLDDLGVMEKWYRGESRLNRRRAPAAAWRRRARRGG